MSILHIHAPPTVLGYTGRVWTTWCFGCCKRRHHRQVIVLDCSGWNGPTGWWRCPTCQDDRTEFGSGTSSCMRRDQEIMPLEVALRVQMKVVRANIASERSEKQ